MKILLFIITIFCYSGLLFFAKPIESNLEKPIYFAPPKIIKHFSFGFSELYADLLWLRLIQDIDFCNSEKGMPVYDGQTRYQCEQGWSYKVTDALTELDPRFLKPYKVAALIMSVVMGDKEGARKIYDKGVRRFPEDWNLNFHAGYHYLLEIKDRKRASELFVQSANHGGPPWLYSLAAQEYGKMGKHLLAQKILKNFLKKDKQGIYKKVIQKKLNEIEKNMQDL